MSGRCKGDKVKGELWRTLYGDRAAVRYSTFTDQLRGYWYQLQGAWWRRFTPEGRRNRAQARWQKAMEVHGGEVQWLRKLRVLWDRLEYVRLVVWGWDLWIKEVARGSYRRHCESVDISVEWHRGEVLDPDNGSRWQCRLCVHVVKWTVGCEDCCKAINVVCE